MPHLSRGELIDDRGRAHVVTRLPKPHGLVRAERRALRKWVAKQTEWRRAFVLIVAILFAFCAIIALVRWSAPFAAIAAILGMGLIVARVTGRHTTSGHAAVMLRLLRRCAVCGANLDGSPSEPDGCTECARCGAAWRAAEPECDEPRPFPHRIGQRWFNATLAIEDANAAVFWLVDFDPLRDKHKVLEPEIRAAITLALERGRRSFRLLERLSTLLLAGFGVVGFLGFTYANAVGWGFGCVPWSIGAFALFMSGYFGVCVVNRRKLRLVLPVLLHRRRCIACGYPLTGVAPDVHGVRTCSECGRSWRMDESESKAEPAS